ncbi:Knottin, scorpion toxin-like [Sesbania bispinosa]|nr:Knottin, scorpion toxin-like [Sesbania bispinosa]
MAICSRQLSTFPAFFCLALLLFAATEVHIGNAEAICGKPSGTFSGTCFSSGQCANQCKERENAVGGACYVLACYCYYDCHRD